VTAALLAFTVMQAQAALPITGADGKIPTLAPLLKQVTPAVVNIAVTAKVPAQQNPLLRDPFFRRFFNFPNQQQRQQIRQAAGSGVIVDAAKGYVITNNHVVKGADEIVVTLKDRRHFKAKLIGHDPGTDIALLQIKAKDLTALQFGDSDKLQVGDFVIAIGNPFALGQTVTSGIVSALGRSGLNIEGYEDFIQTDASINPGNSGGALIDLKGKLVGINTAIIGPAGGNVGIGFAVPSVMVRSITAQLAKYGKVKRGHLGVLIQDLTPDLAKALSVDAKSGAVINQVQPKSPADKAGLRAGDVVLKLNGREIHSSADLRNRIGLMRVGEKLELGILRDGKLQTVNAVVGEPQAPKVAGGEASPQLAGAVFENVKQGNPLFGKVDGAMVAQIEQGSPAWRHGLRPNDIIIGVNRQRVHSVDEFNAALKSVGGVLALNVLRGDARLFIVIQ